MKQYTVLLTSTIFCFSCNETASLENSSSSNSLSHNEIFVHKKHADISFNYIKIFYQQQQLTDVTLIAGNANLIL